MACRCGFILAAPTAGLAVSDVEGMDAKKCDMKTKNYIKTYYGLYFTEWKWVILGIGALPIFALILLDGMLYDITHPLSNF